jgi:hypothetical protein
MIQSKFRKGAIGRYWILLLMSFLSAFITYAIISVHFFESDLFGSALTKEQSVIFIIFFFLITLLFIKVLIVSALRIEIDTNKQEIILTHIFLKTKKKYLFSDFDYYIDTVEESRQGSFKAIYLIKNKRLKMAIRGFYYSNIDELQDALTSIQSLGFKKYGWLSSLLVYFIRKV